MRCGKHAGSAIVCDGLRWRGLAAIFEGVIRAGLIGFFGVPVGALILASCGGGDDAALRVGSTCEDSQQCQSGLCGAGICLEQAADDDDDGVINSLEVTILGTNPRNPDTDGDGTRDPDELDANFGAIDTDGDGTIDALESAVLDADGDCISDQDDAADGVNNSQQSPLLKTLCKQQGVCATAAADLRLTCGKDGGSARCDYGLVTDYEAVETLCDNLDNDCNGEVDDGAAQQACVPVLQTIEVQPATVVLAAGETVVLAAIGHFDRGDPRDLGAEVMWGSSDSAIASVSSAGLVTAVAPGNVQIVARGGDGAVQGTAEVAVTEAVVATLSLGDVSLTLPDGRSAQLSAVATYTDGTMVDVTETLTWLSDNEPVATVTPGGLVTAHDPGSALISGTDGQLTAMLTVTVGPPDAVAIVIDPAETKVGEGETVQLSAIGTMSDGSVQDVTTQAQWGSDDPGVASVDGGLVSGVLAGQTVVSATLGEAVGTAAVDVFVPVPLRLVIARPAVRAIVQGPVLTASTAGNGALNTTVARPRLRTIVLEGGRTDTNINTITNHTPIKVEFDSP